MPETDVAEGCRRRTDVGEVDELVDVLAKAGHRAGKGASEPTEFKPPGRAGEERDFFAAAALERALRKNRANETWAKR